MSVLLAPLFAFINYPNLRLKDTRNSQTKLTINSSSPDRGTWTSKILEMYLTLLEKLYICRRRIFEFEQSMCYQRSDFTIFCRSKAGIWTCATEFVVSRCLHVCASLQTAVASRKIHLLFGILYFNLSGWRVPYAGGNIFCTHEIVTQNVTVLSQITGQQTLCRLRVFDELLSN